MPVFKCRLYSKRGAIKCAVSRCFIERLMNIVPEEENILKITFKRINPKHFVE